jgi:hypothetical protein
MKVETNVVRNLADLKQKEMKAIYAELARIDKEGGNKGENGGYRISDCFKIT